MAAEAEAQLTGVQQLLLARCAHEHARARSEIHMLHAARQSAARRYAAWAAQADPASAAARSGYAASNELACTDALDAAHEALQELDTWRAALGWQQRMAAPLTAGARKDKAGQQQRPPQYQDSPRGNKRRVRFHE